MDTLLSTTQSLLNSTQKRGESIDTVLGGREFADIEVATDATVTAAQPAQEQGAEDNKQTDGKYTQTAPQDLGGGLVAEVWEYVQGDGTTGYRIVYKQTTASGYVYVKTITRGAEGDTETNWGKLT